MPAGTLTLVRNAKRGVPRKISLRRYRTVHSRKNRTNNKYSIRTNASSGLRTLKNPFGKKYWCNLRYVENMAISANGTTGLSAIQEQFTLNNVFDPRYSVGGHQPYLYDQISPMYERLWVWGAKVTLEFSNPTHDGMYVGYRVRSTTNGNGTANRTLDFIQELRDSKCKPVNNTGAQTTKYSFYVSNPKVMGITNIQYNNLEYSHTVGGSPSVQSLLEPFAVHTVAGETGVIRCNVIIDYKVCFTNPITQPQS